MRSGGADLGRRDEDTTAIRLLDCCHRVNLVGTTSSFLSFSRYFMLGPGLLLALIVLAWCLVGKSMKPQSFAAQNTSV